MLYWLENFTYKTFTPSYPHTLMDHFTRLRRLMRASIALGTLVTLLGSTPVAYAATTLLVNTESFDLIDAGDGTTNIELRFGNSTKTIKFLTSNKFQFSHAISVLGNISGSTLMVDGEAIIKGGLSASGATRLESTLQVDGATTLNSTATINGNTKVRGFLSGSTLRTDGRAEFHSIVTASGSIKTESGITINSDSDTSDAKLVFGNNTADQTLKYMNTAQRFEFSKDLKVNGSISGSSLIVDGTTTLRGVNYNWSTSQGGSNTFLRNDGAGNLTWTTTSVGNGSGGIMSFHPEYPNAIYYSSGSTTQNVGQLAMSGGTTALDNSYLWTTTRSGIQQYWVSVRFRLPDNFSSWDPIKPIELRYKTGVASAANNHVTIRMKDTAGADRPLSSGGGLSNTSWTTANVTGPEAGGTWAPKGYATVYIKLAADSTGNAAAGFLNLNYETTTP